MQELKILFHQKMFHVIWLNVTKFQQLLLITVEVADEKPEGGWGGGGKPAPCKIRDKKKLDNGVTQLMYKFHISASVT